VVALGAGHPVKVLTPKTRLRSTATIYPSIPQQNAIE
jgi:hypothetical protein